ncbi:MAG: redoxin domain-containing protein [Cellulophaga sp.]
MRKIIQSRIQQTILFRLQFTLLILFFGITYANEGYQIKIRINGLKNSKAYFGYYQGANPYVKDSALVDSKGDICFKGRGKLLEGVYFFYSKVENFSFDFVITGSETSLKTSKVDPLEELVDLGSEDNNLFRQFRIQINAYQKDMGSLGQLLASAKSKKDSLTYTIQMKKRESKLLQLQKTLIKAHENTTIGCILQYMRMPEQAPIYPEKWKNMTYQRERKQFYRNHYWDHINFSDSLLLRVPILKYRINEFFDDVIAQEPDSIIKAMNAVVAKASENPAVFKETLRELTFKYIAPAVLDQDRVFVHLADTYLLTQETMDWININMRQHISNITEKMRSNIIGKEAPSLHMNTLDGEEMRLHTIGTEYTLLFFYDPDCDHCIDESLILKSEYEQLKKDNVEIMAVCISRDSEKCKQYATDYKIDWVNVMDPENSTGYREKYNIFAAPIVFLLDDEKKIIGKATSFEHIRHLIP